MGRKVLSLLMLMSFLLLSCGREEGVFTLSGTLQDGSSDSILVIGLDSRFARTDTIRPEEGSFKWSFRPDTVTTLILILPDGRQYPVFADRDVRAHITIPSEGDSIETGGSPENEAYTEFAWAAMSDTCLGQICARMDSFIVNDPFSEVTPYLIYEYGVRRWHAGSADLLSLIGKMSGNMQDAPYITALKSEFQIDNRVSRYLESFELYDTAGVSYDFRNISGARNSLLVCLWASWNDSIGIKARRSMKGTLERFDDSRLAVTDVSVDVNPSRWKDVVEADTLNWFSYNDVRGWSSTLVTLASVRKLPCFVLLSETSGLLYVSESLDRMEHAIDSLVQKKEKPVQKKR